MSLPSRSRARCQISRHAISFVNDSNDTWCDLISCNSHHQAHFRCLTISLALIHSPSVIVFFCIFVKWVVKRCATDPLTKSSDLSTERNLASTQGLWKNLKFRLAEGALSRHQCRGLLTACLPTSTFDCLIGIFLKFSYTSWS